MQTHEDHIADPWIQFFESLQFGSPANTYSKNSDNSGSKGSSGQGMGQIQKFASSGRIHSKKQKRSNCSFCYGCGIMPPDNSENKFQTYKERVAQNGGQQRKLKTHVEKLMSTVDPEEPTQITDQVYLGCTQRESVTNCDRKSQTYSRYWFHPVLARLRSSTMTPSTT